MPRRNFCKEGAIWQAAGPFHSKTGEFNAIPGHVLKFLFKLVDKFIVILGPLFDFWAFKHKGMFTVISEHPFFFSPTWTEEICAISCVKQQYTLMRFLLTCSSHSISLFKATILSLLSTMSTLILWILTASISIWTGLHFSICMSSESPATKGSFHFSIFSGLEGKFLYMSSKLLFFSSILVFDSGTHIAYGTGVGFPTRDKIGKAIVTSCLPNKWLPLVTQHLYYASTCLVMSTKGGP